MVDLHDAPATDRSEDQDHTRETMQVPKQSLKSSCKASVDSLAFSLLVVTSPPQAEASYCWLILISRRLPPSASENQATIALGPVASTPPKSTPALATMPLATTQPRAPAPAAPVDKPAAGRHEKSVAEQERRVDHPKSAGSSRYRSMNPTSSTSARVVSAARGRAEMAQYSDRPTEEGK